MGKLQKYFVITVIILFSVHFKECKRSKNVFKISMIENFSISRIYMFHLIIKIFKKACIMTIPMIM